jgi:heptaprenyl diphosphate synthase
VTKSQVGHNQGTPESKPVNGATANPATAGEWLVCEQTRLALAQLDQTLRAAITADDLQMRMMALDLIGRGGKRLRPAVLFLAASFGQSTATDLQPAAAAMELFHVASLYHDDVMDRAPRRRKGASVNQRWGNLAATLAGAYLFARGSMLLATLGNNANQLASRAALDLCAGQLQEVENAFNLELDEVTYMQIIERKTATLFETPCHLGALLSGTTTENIAALRAYGRHLGLAFQLADDALDLVGDVHKTGKGIGTDLREGVYSLPVLRALQTNNGNASMLPALLTRATLGEEEVRQAVQLVRDSGAVLEVRELAHSYSEQAQAALETLPDGPARQSLYHLADYAVARHS